MLVMKKVQIIQEIDVTVFKRRGPIDDWRIGVTGNPDETKQLLSRKGHDTSRWHHWRADTSYDATTIGDLFRMLGMQEAGYGMESEESEVVYVY
jgi:hypothetical protein